MRNLDYDLCIFLHMHEYGSLKPVEVILRRGRGKKDYNGGDEPN
jgi:hypothetical protein